MAICILWITFAQIYSTNSEVLSKDYPCPVQLAIRVQTKIMADNYFRHWGYMILHVKMVRMLNLYPEMWRREKQPIMSSDPSATFLHSLPAALCLPSVHCVSQSRVVLYKEAVSRGRAAVQRVTHTDRSRRRSAFTGPQRDTQRDRQVSTLRESAIMQHGNALSCVYVCAWERERALSSLRSCCSQADQCEAAWECVLTAAMSNGQTCRCMCVVSSFCSHCVFSHELLNAVLISCSRINTDGIRRMFFIVNTASFRSNRAALLS